MLGVGRSFLDLRDDGVGGSESSPEYADELPGEMKKVLVEVFLLFTRFLCSVCSLWYVISVCLMFVNLIVLL